MPSNGMNLGVDYQFGLFDQNTGQIIDLGDIQTVTMTALKTDASSKPYNRPPRYAHVADGYRGTFEIVRTNSEMEDLQIALNQAFNDGTVMRPGFISETVINPDGSVKKYQYINVDFFMTGVGTVTRDREVRQTVEWMASDKVNIA